ncbi:MAG: cytochrome c biogenesis protein [Acidobacteriia bacterium]|nr:cytochrome c biogenesis protein [Terriglobia bacterium]
MKRAFPVLSILTAILLSYALYQALVVAPTEQTMGDVQRIFYYHVPSAWTAFFLFFINFVASIQYLARANSKTDRLASYLAVGIGVVVFAAAFFIPLPEGMRPSAVGTTGLLATGLYLLVRSLFSQADTDVLALVTAEVGVAFCLIVLVTGPIWARPVWGIWWAPGDIRLTSTLVLWLIYVSYLVLRRFSASGQTPILAAALAVLGALCVPFVYLSIWFFRTQHPQPVMGGSGSIDPRMMHALLINWLAFMCFAFLVCWSRYRLEKLRREVDEVHALESLKDVSRSAR